MIKRNRLEWQDEAQRIEVIQIHSTSNKENKRFGTRQTQPTNVFNISPKTLDMPDAAVQPAIAVHNQY